MFGYVFGLYIIFVYVQTKFWVVNNIIAMAVCVYTIESMVVARIRDILISFYLLGVYDLYFVFFTGVMMTVAKGFDAPLKLLFPIEGFVGFSMIGIGDIIVPGLLTALCCRADLIKNLQKQCSKKSTSKEEFVSQIKIGDGSDHSYFYFKAMLISFNAGLLLTMLSMYHTNIPQPALIYILPTMFFGYLGSAFLRHET